MNTRFLAFFLVFSFILGTSGYAQAAATSPADSRYFVSTTKAFWRTTLGARNVFEDGFTADLSDLQVRIARFAGLKLISVKKFTILADAQTPSPEPSDVPQLTPAAPMPWGVELVSGSALPHKKGGAGITVAVLDTGVDVSHPDLARRISGCKDFSGAQAVEDEFCADENGHGTHIAGIIAADGGPDGVGIWGVAPAANILAYKVCSRSGSCWSDDIAKAIDAAVDSGANIIVLGLGGELPSSFIADSIAAALEKQVLVVAAAGNDGPYPESIDFPASVPGVLAVGAVDSDMKVPEWSSRGANLSTKAYRMDDGDLEFAAPGVNIESAWRDGGYAILSGTSMAAPHVAGLAALLWQPKEESPADATRLLLREYAKDIAPVGDDAASGWGLPMLQ